MSTMNLMKTPTTLYTVTTVNGTSRRMTLRKANKIARELREGRTGRRVHAAPMAATVQAAL